MIIKKLEARGWFCNVTHGNMYQSGFPDVYAMHPVRRLSRWIEVKNPTSFKFTDAQKLWYPRMIASGIPIWVLMGHDDTQLALLNGPPNLEQVMLGKML